MFTNVSPDTSPNCGFTALCLWCSGVQQSQGKKRFFPIGPIYKDYMLLFNCTLIICVSHQITIIDFCRRSKASIPVIVAPASVDRQSRTSLTFRELDTSRLVRSEKQRFSPNSPYKVTDLGGGTPMLPL